MTPLDGNSSYTNPTKLVEAIREASDLLRAQHGDLLDLNELRQAAAAQGGYALSSIIPSDYCYNLINEDPSSFRYYLFEWMSQGKYKYLGPNYAYTGDILWRPKGGESQGVGSWNDGKFILQTDPRSSSQTNDVDTSHSIAAPQLSGPLARPQTPLSRIFGQIVGYPKSSSFGTRLELSRAGIHRPTQAGISGSGHEGADSIVLSGGYEDDEDLGDIIVYTGHGGQDEKTRRQIADQTLTKGNLALASSCLNGLPVRVIRGYTHTSPFSPTSGYRYDGLFRVDDYWRDLGRSGFNIRRYRLIKIEETVPSIEEPLPGQNPIDPDASGDATPRRRRATTVRIVRDTAQARKIKELYDYHCQICDIRLEGSAGPYAEAAHIRPLGTPHNGPDTTDNILCLCPNHHVLFDYGGIAIADDFMLIGAEGRLNVHPKHHINRHQLRYHRDHYYAA